MDFIGCSSGVGRCNVDWHEPPALMKSANIYSSSSVFCVVRNPFARALSEYKYAYANPEYRFSHGELVEREGCSAQGLNEWMSRVLESFLQGDVYEQLCHMLPQSDYIWGPSQKRGQQCRYCHEVIHLEGFPNSFNALMERYNYSIRLGPHDRSNAGGCTGLRPSDINSTNVELIRTIYRRDFAWLNYSASVEEAG